MKTVISGKVQKGYVAKSALGLSRENLTAENVGSDSLQLGRRGIVDVSYRFSCYDVPEDGSNIAAMKFPTF